MKLTAFKHNAICGKLGDELNEAVAWKIGCAYAAVIGPQKIVVGRDVRLSSSVLCDALVDGLISSGVDVYDLGLCGTEEVHFAVLVGAMDGGIMVTGGTEPHAVNGMKLVREQCLPLTAANGLNRVRVLAEQDQFFAPIKRGKRRSFSVRESYCHFLLSHINQNEFSPLKILINPGNGCAGPLIQALKDYLPFTFFKINHHPDNILPAGIPDPRILHQQASTSAAINYREADIGIAWDVPFERCCLFDESGQSVNNYYLTGLIVEALMEKHHGGRVVYDPCLRWDTLETAGRLGGLALPRELGRYSMYDFLLKNRCVYGSDADGLHYFSDFGGSHSGMIPWLLILELMSQRSLPLSHLVAERMIAFPSRSEQAQMLPDFLDRLDHIERRYAWAALAVDCNFGLGMEFAEWRFYVCNDQSQQILRLYVESRGDIDLVNEKTDELMDLLRR